MLPAKPEKREDGGDEEEEEGQEEEAAGEVERASSSTCTRPDEFEKVKWYSEDGATEIQLTTLRPMQTRRS